MTNKKLLQLKKRYIKEGYKKALKEYYTEDGDHYFEHEEIEALERKLSLINRIFEECASASRRGEFSRADSLYQELTDEVEIVLSFLKDN